MAKFAVGDTVERIGSLIPDYLKNGVVVRIIPNQDGVDWLTEYEVRFSSALIAGFYETQLRLVRAKDS
jgi:hypothetical protein